MKNIVSKFQNTDPEFAELIQNFACDEVVNNDDLDDHTRMIADLSTLIGSQSVDAFKEMLGYALETGVTPVEVKEIVYQAAAYLGLGRVFPLPDKYYFSVPSIYRISEKLKCTSVRERGGKNVNGT